MRKFKYYHGTSTVFIDSIKRTGLGGINPNTDLKTLELLKFLFLEAKKQIPQNDYFKKNINSITAMVNQSSIDLVMSNGKIQRYYFQHDGIYIALSLQRAIIYASINKYGSEILETCIKLYNELLKNGCALKIPENINLISIEQISRFTPESIIIEISNIEDEDLEKEDGKTAKEGLDFIRNIMPTMTEKEKFEFFQYCNFKLLKPVESKNLKFFKLNTKGFPGNPDFEYKLTEY